MLVTPGVSKTVLSVILFHHRGNSVIDCGLLLKTVCIPWVMTVSFFGKIQAGLKKEKNNCLQFMVQVKIIFLSGGRLDLLLHFIHFNGISWHEYNEFKVQSGFIIDIWNNKSFVFVLNQEGFKSFIWKRTIND